MSLDTSRARCRECGKLYQPGDAMYSPATKIVTDQEPRVMLSFCHAQCHVPLDGVLGDLRGKLRDMQERLKR